jgi:hypothetical protein
MADAKCIPCTPRTEDSVDRNFKVVVPQGQ